MVRGFGLNGSLDLLDHGPLLNNNDLEVCVWTFQLPRMQASTGQSSVAVGTVCRHCSLPLSTFVWKFNLSTGTLEVVLLLQRGRAMLCVVSFNIVIPRLESFLIVN